MDKSNSDVFSVCLNMPEKAGWEEYQKKGDPALRQQLILANIRLVYYAYGRMNVQLPEGMEREDAISYGITGLIEAIDRYDVKKGQFSSLAYPRIQGAIYDGILQFRWLKKQDLRKSRQWIMVPLETAQELPEEAPEKSPEFELMRESGRQVLQKAIGELESREEEILYKHYFEGRTLRQIAAETGRSTSRVSELHRKGLSVLREKLKNAEIL